jgi:hypothetical protein
MKSNLLKKTLCILVVCTLLISSTKTLNFSSVSPEGYSGATGAYCNTCHADYPLNVAGGSVELTGLPNGNYTPNTTYNLSLKINHFANDRTRWGFAIKAINNAGNAIGTFSTSNPNAYINGDELSHFYAITTGAQNSFTYDSLKWTAPATPGNATFYYAGNAANNSSGNDGDYIYSGVSAIVLPIRLKYFSAKLINESASLSWETVGNINLDFFDIERSDDGQFFFNIGNIKSSTNQAITTYNFTDNNTSSNQRSNIFYRIKTIDKNGEIHYSKTVSVQMKNTALSIKNIYPTIIKQNSTISIEIISQQNNNMKILLMDVAGKVLQTNDVTLLKGFNKIQLPITKICSIGVKFLRCINSNFTETKTIIIAK